MVRLLMFFIPLGEGCPRCVLVSCAYTRAFLMVGCMEIVGYCRVWKEFTRWDKKGTEALLIQLPIIKHEDDYHSATIYLPDTGLSSYIRYKSPSKVSEAMKLEVEKLLISRHKEETEALFMPFWFWKKE